MHSDPPLWIQSPDKRGIPIQSELLDAAQRNWKRILSHARRHRQDASQAAEILETVVHSLSKVIRRNHRSGKQIESLDYYLYWAFVRRLNRRLAHEPVIDYVGSLDDLEALKRAEDTGWAKRVEEELLIKELQGYMTERPRRIFFLQEIGCSWKEIARELEISINNAQVQFNQGVKKARTRIWGRRRPKPQSTSREGGARNA